MAKLKVLCVVGTRPEAVKVAPVVLALRERVETFHPILMGTGQHRDMLEPMLAPFGLRPDVDLDVMQAGQSLTDVTIRILGAMTDYLHAHRPDMVLAQGDTTTVMAASLACFYAHVPFAHLEAGLRTGRIRTPFPEELNRRIASLVAAHHFAPTQSAADNLLREGIDPATVHVVGNTVIDALEHILATTEAPPKPVPAGARYILMTCHRREIFGAKIREVFEAVRVVARAHRDLFVWFPVHPNPHVAGPAGEILAGEPNVVLGEPLGYVSFLHAMKGAFVVLTDSGGVQEEAPALGKPVLVLRDVTERPEGVAAGTCELVGPHRERIIAALTRLVTDPSACARMCGGTNPYGDGHSAARIASILSASPALHSQKKA